MRGIWIILASITLGGCAVTPPSERDVFHRANTSGEQLARDRHDCIASSQQSVTSGGFYQGTGSVRSETVVKRPMFVSCMVARGYTITPDGTAPYAIVGRGPAVLMVP
jgi:hypothetical protein